MSTKEEEIGPEATIEESQTTGTEEPEVKEDLSPMARLQKLITTDSRVGWPVQIQNLPINLHGWFRTGNEATLRRLLPKNGECVVELGSWLGRSTKFICEQCPKSLVIAVDIWKNDHFAGDSHYNKNDAEFSQILNSSPIYDQFLNNLQPHRVQWTEQMDSAHGLLPMKMSSVDALPLIHAAGIQPGLIYIDASHHYDDVVKDVELCLDLFPKAVLVGDDWDNKDVSLAVTYVAKRRNLSTFITGKTCWTFARERMLFLNEQERKEKEAQARVQQQVQQLKSKRGFDAEAVREMMKKAKKN